MRNIFIIARRDLRAQFNSPVAYVVLGGTMFLLGVVFFLIPHISGVLAGSFWDVDRASMDQMFAILPLLMSIFVIPAVTMRSLAAEKGSGTLELLITMPVKDSEVILGKYLAAFAMVMILLAATLLYPIAMFKFPWNLGPLDWGPVWAGYLGCIFFSAAAVGVGMMLSSLTESDVIAFFMTLGVLAIVYAIGWIVSVVHTDSSSSTAIVDALGFISFQTRYQSFARGLIDLRAIIYFLSVTVLCLLVS
ncbi:MAG: ABC transporter permease, partial [Polyangiaceae bacterium]